MTRQNSPLKERYRKFKLSLRILFLILIFIINLNQHNVKP